MDPTMMDMMTPALDEMFGRVLDAHLQPLTVRLTELEVQVHALVNQTGELLAQVEKVRNAGGMVGRLLGG